MSQTPSASQASNSDSIPCGQGDNPNYQSSQSSTSSWETCDSQPSTQSTWRFSSGEPFDRTPTQYTQETTDTFSQCSNTSHYYSQPNYSSNLTESQERELWGGGIDSTQEDPWWRSRSTQP